MGSRLTTIAASFFLGLSFWGWPAVSGAVTTEDLDKRLAICTVVLNDVMSMPERRIPRDLLQRSRGLAIFPGLFQVGAVVAVSFGDGVVLHRDEKSGKWSRPAFFRIRGGSLGVQLGAQSIDLILLVMSEQGMQGLLEDRFTLGLDASVAAGPVGRDASAETNIRFDAGILSYSRSKGLFAGISVAGAVLEPDVQANEIYHGKGITVQDVFYEDKGSLSGNAQALVEFLDKATPP